jgi:hypothetical protein
LYPTLLRPEKPWAQLSEGEASLSPRTSSVEPRRKPQAIPLAFPAAEFHTTPTFSFFARKKLADTEPYSGFLLANVESELSSNT